MLSRRNTELRSDGCDSTITRDCDVCCVPSGESISCNQQRNPEKFSAAVTKMMEEIRVRAKVWNIDCLKYPKILKKKLPLIDFGHRQRYVE